MGDYKKNPKQPFMVRVPNKIRKKFAWHETDAAAAARVKFTKNLTRLEKIAALPPVPVVKKKGSMWSRFSIYSKDFFRKIENGVLQN